MGALFVELLMDHFHFANLLEVYFDWYLAFIETPTQDLVEQIYSLWYPIVLLVIAYISTSTWKMMQDNKFIVKMMLTLHKIIH